MDELLEPSPELVDAVGRVVYWTALLEVQLIELAIRLDWALSHDGNFATLQQKYRAFQGAGLVAEVRTLAGSANASDDLDGLLDAAAACQEERNHLAHNAFFEVAGVGLVGFRTMRPNVPGDALQFGVFDGTRLSQAIEQARDCATAVRSALDRFELPAGSYPDPQDALEGMDPPQHA